MTLEQWILIPALLLILGLLILAGRRLMLGIEQRQRETIKKRKKVSPIATESPLDHPARSAKQKALKSVGRRFTVIRRGLMVIVLLLLIMIASIPLLGILPAAAVSLAIGLVGVIVGIAARSTLENLIAGIMLTFSGVIREGDTVIVGDHYGTIEDITWTHCVIKIWNWRRHLIPNSELLSRDFVNLTIHDSYQWCHVEFWVAADADLKEVKKAAIEAAQMSESHAGYEDPKFWVMEMGKEGLKCWIAAWADSPSEAWELGNDIRTELTARLQQLGILYHRVYFTLDQSRENQPSLTEVTQSSPPHDIRERYQA
ncbi:mechanosensitive ion channel family protein [Dongshaea marina]|uniref:mechanosensitive ion channel family protein n=1 Tax=Dongshaea marina TaxID=2047966 RepID=UPI000D3E7266|nr:mechanosensitive ion channel domain-containing protein [Dongshaea marina]